MKGFPGDLNQQQQQIRRKLPSLLMLDSKEGRGTEMGEKEFYLENHVPGFRPFILFRKLKL